jgi:hypothetical protein
VISRKYGSEDTFWRAKLSPAPVPAHHSTRPTRHGGRCASPVRASDRQGVLAVRAGCLPTPVATRGEARKSEREDVLFNSSQGAKHESSSKKDLYAQVNDSNHCHDGRRHAALNRHAKGNGIRCNHKSGVPYLGDVLLLQAEAMMQGYSGATKEMQKPPKPRPGNLPEAFELTCLAIFLPLN